MLDINYVAISQSPRNRAQYNNLIRTTLHSYAARRTQVVLIDRSTLHLLTFRHETYVLRAQDKQRINLHISIEVLGS